MRVRVRAPLGPQLCPGSLPCERWFGARVPFLSLRVKPQLVPSALPLRADPLPLRLKASAAALARPLASWCALPQQACASVVLRRSRPYSLPGHDGTQQRAPLPLSQPPLVLRHRLCSGAVCAQALFVLRRRLCSGTVCAQALFVLRRRLCSGAVCTQAPLCGPSCPAPHHPIVKGGGWLTCKHAACAHLPTARGGEARKGELQARGRAGGAVPRGREEAYSRHQVSLLRPIRQKLTAAIR